MTRDIEQAIRREFAERIGADRFELWFERYDSPRLREKSLHVHAPDSFTLDWIRKQFHSTLHQLVSQLSDSNIGINYRVDDELKAGADGIAAAPQSSTPQPALAPLAPTVTDSNASPRIVHLDQLVTGDNNRMAVTTAQHLLNHMGEVTPLFVAGPTGCGKSHLLQAIYKDAIASRRLGRCVHLSAEQFTSAFLEALHGRGLPSFRAKHRDVDLLVVDDIHFLAGKRATIVEFHHTLDQLLRSGKQVVVSSNRLPGELADLGGELVARLSEGLVCSMDYPQGATKLSLVNCLAERKGLELPTDIAEILVDEVSGDARRISGALNRILALKIAGNPCSNAEQAREHLKDLLSAQQPSVGIHEIEQAVCDAFGIESELLRSANKSRQFSQPRMLAMYLARRHTRAALSEIGDYFGGRSHSTVIAAQKTVDKWVADEKRIGTTRRPLLVQDAIRQIERRLRAS